MHMAKLQKLLEYYRHRLEVGLLNSERPETEVLARFKQRASDAIQAANPYLEDQFGLKHLGQRLTPTSLFCPDPLGESKNQEEEMETVSSDMSNIRPFG